MGADMVFFKKFDIVEAFYENQYRPVTIWETEKKNIPKNIMKKIQNPPFIRRLYAGVGRKWEIERDEKRGMDWWDATKKQYKKFECKVESISYSGVLFLFDFLEEEAGVYMLDYVDYWDDSGGERYLYMFDLHKLFKQAELVRLLESQLPWLELEFSEDIRNYKRVVEEGYPILRPTGGVEDYGYGYCIAKINLIVNRLKDGYFLGFEM